MTGEPEAKDEYVAYTQGQRPALYEPAEAEALAMSLLGAAQRARAYRLAGLAQESREDGERRGDDGSPEKVV